MQIQTIREWQFNILRMNLNSYRRLLRSFDMSIYTKYRDGGQGWTVTEVVGHLRDFEDVFIERAKLLVNEDNPQLPFPDPDELASERNYNNIGWRILLEEWIATRNTHLDYLQTLSEADWERHGQHPTRGVFTMTDQLHLNTLHDAIHMEQITKIINHKKF